MKENEVASIVVDTCYKIHSRIGPGLLESVYEVILATELKNKGLEVKRQASIPIIWDSTIIHEGFRADLLVNDILIIELKSVEKLASVHAKQLLTYLRLSDKRLGLLINFGETLIKNGIKRVVNRLEEKETC